MSPTPMHVWFSEYRHLGQLSDLCLYLSLDHVIYLHSPVVSFEGLDDPCIMSLRHTFQPSQEQISEIKISVHLDVHIIRTYRSTIDVFRRAILFFFLFFCFFCFGGIPRYDLYLFVLSVL